MAHSGCCCVPLSGFWDPASSRHLATLLSLADLLPGGHSCDTRQRVSWQGKLSAHFEWIRVPKWSSNLYRGLVSHALLRVPQGSVLTPLLIWKAARVCLPLLHHRFQATSQEVPKRPQLWSVRCRRGRMHQRFPLISGENLRSSKCLCQWCVSFKLYCHIWQMKRKKQNKKHSVCICFYWLMQFCCSLKSAAMKISGS